ncbi:MAG: M48 family metalloprotease [Desulfovibrionaceae bacterium]|nr:M48 family metalloprotease [Desulfovibrionaceae bacterium]
MKTSPVTPANPENRPEADAGPESAVQPETAVQAEPVTQQAESPDGPAVQPQSVSGAAENPAVSAAQPEAVTQPEPVTRSEAVKHPEAALQAASQAKDPAPGAGTPQSSKTPEAADPKTGMAQFSNRTFFFWYLLVLAGIVCTALIIFGDRSQLPLLIAAYATAVSFFLLLISKSAAIQAHNIHLVTEESLAEDGTYRELYDTVRDLAAKAGLPKTPSVGVYESPDMNAFATGFSRSSALVAFSTALLENMPLNEVRAVAAHETAHIANRDMLGTVLIQSAVNSITLLIVTPLKLYQFFMTTTGNGRKGFEWYLTEAVKFVATKIVMFIGNLFALAFSRHREYRADRAAAYLASSEDMCAALRRLSQDTAVCPPRQTEYASFKISRGGSKIAELFSTHPDIEKRIAALGGSAEGLAAGAAAGTAAGAVAGAAAAAAAGSAGEGQTAEAAAEGGSGAASLVRAAVESPEAAELVKAAADSPEAKAALLGVANALNGAPEAGEAAAPGEAEEDEPVDVEEEEEEDWDDEE